MRIKIVNVESPEDLKSKLSQAVDKLLGFGIPKFSNANLYVGLRAENGNELRIQTPEGDELILVIGLKQQKYPSMYFDVSEESRKIKRKTKKTKE